jgi:hypothetical protein
MATLAEVREKYPQYKDLSDQQLADGLYKKYYSDLPREEFDRKVGLAPQQTAAPQMPPQAQAAPAAPTAQPRTVQGGFREMMTGMTNQFLGGTQRTSPLADKPLGELGQYDFGEGFTDTSGHFTKLDPTRHAVLLDPQSGKPMVFAKTPENQEGLAPSVGRVLGGGAIAGPVAGVARTAAPAAAKAPELLKAFDRARVDPSLAAVSQSRGAALLQNTAKEMPIAGGMLVKDAGKQIRQASDEASRISQGYGRAPDETGRVAGGNVQQGLRTFKEETFPTRGGQLYEKFWKFFPEGETIDLSNTRAALKGPTSKFDDPEVGQLFADPTFQKWAEVLEAKGGKLSMNDARAFRTEVGARSDIDETHVRRLYEAMSKDLETAATAKSPEALKAMKNADAYWRAGKERIKSTANLIGAKASEESVYQSLIRMAQTKGSQADFNKLAQVRRSMPAEEWEDFTATFIANMGKPKPSATGQIAEIGFSPESFVTNWKSLSDQAKAIMFYSTGKAEWAKAMDDLAAVTGSLKNVEALAGHSGTPRIGITALVGGLAATDLSTAVLVTAGAIGAEKLLMSPHFVRALTQLGRARHKTAMPDFVNRLKNLAVNPEVGPAAYRLAEALAGPDTTPPERTKSGTAPR